MKRVIVNLFCLVAMILLWSVNWKIAIGVFLFGVAIDLENREY